MIKELLEKAERLLAEWPQDTPLKQIRMLTMDDLFLRFFDGVDTGYHNIVLYRGTVEMSPGSMAGHVATQVRVANGKILIKPDIVFTPSNTIKQLLSTLYHEFVHLEQAVKMLDKNRSRFLQNAGRYVKWKPIEKLFPGAYRFDTEDDQQYHRDPMEINAYAREFSRIFKQKGLKLEDVKVAIQNPEDFVQLIEGTRAADWYLNRLDPQVRQKFLHTLIKQFSKISKRKRRCPDCISPDGKLMHGLRYLVNSPCDDCGGDGCENCRGIGYYPCCRCEGTGIDLNPD